MYGKKTWMDKRYLFIIIILLVAVALVIISISLKKDRNLSPIETFFKDAGSAVINTISKPFNGAKNKRSNSEESNDSITAENKNLKDENRKLKELLDLKTTLGDKVIVNATIITRNIGYWYSELTIDKGSKDGVEKDMAVITPKGLIGRITKTANHTSTVKLLSTDNMENKISVKISVDDNFVYGLISKYDSKTNSYTVEGISQNVDIKEGAEVVTTGMGSIFPSGILVGKVKGTSTDHFDLSKVAVVEASVDFNDLDYVSVLKRGGE